MNAISYTATRQNSAKTMKKVCGDHEPVIITRKSSICLHHLCAGLNDDYCFQLLTGIGT